MKQLIIILSIVLGIILLGVAGLFTWNKYEENQMKKMEIQNQQKKSDEKIKKKESVKKHTPSKKKESNEEEINEIANTTEEDTTETQVDMSNDYNGDGVISSDEMAPEQEQLAKEDEFQPTNPVEEPQENEEEQASQRPDPNAMSDDEFLEAYKKGMPSDEANSVDELADNPDYVEYLRGQIEARENGQGGNY
ncbi:hypothetical protein JTF04_06180 [Mammaliicoccus vitulinus]|uniref:hypothetical protein n=1 Tax=Mammaliicoccus vitulinus TaxID=71237 RepID=UPI00194F293C|nr:hypothetical protein [Mammaliicoccus vitulinus]MBM6629269.1 hypothetical protein [Mammaliicoccus vitulinus]